MSKKQRSRKLSTASIRANDQADAPKLRSRRKLVAMAVGLALGVLLAVGLLLRARGQIAASGPQLYTYDVVQEYPHDPDAFTQGLEYDRSGDLQFFWESTGMYGQSSVRQVELATGKVLQVKMLDKADFGEGITRFGDKLYQEIWQHGTLYEYSVNDFQNVKSLAGPLADGWGITTDNTSLILSDGSDKLTFVNPATMAAVKTITVTDGLAGVHALNELEWVEGEIWANIWMTDCIARIDPASGTVKSWILLGTLRSNLLAQNIQQTNQMDVLNGIAYDGATKHVFVTGKYWPRLYEIKARLQSASPNPVELLTVRRACIKNSSGFK